MLKFLILCIFVTACSLKKITLLDNVLLTFKNDFIIIKEGGETYEVKAVKPLGEIQYTINGNDVFITSLNKNVIKLSLKDHKIDWIKNLGTTPQNNFVFDNKYVYFNGFDNNFYILNYKTGDVENIIFNTPVKTITNVRKPYIYNNKMVVFFNNNEIYVIENNRDIKQKLFYEYSFNIDADRIIIDNKREIKL